MASSKISGALQNVLEDLGIEDQGKDDYIDDYGAEIGNDCLLMGGGSS